MSKTESEKVVSVSSRGQATIPKEFREELGIDTPGRVKFVGPKRVTSLFAPSTRLQTCVGFWKEGRRAGALGNQAPPGGTRSGQSQ